ncbi:MAG: restriction endonuclease subunit S [Muribaculaceae bacterium]|nr:restriction endonuclease subunit S [Muribaculaceae bacterium]
MVINMARGEKKKELSLEEKLEQALVPVEEWPYGVPGNWCWVRLKEICEFERGITFPTSAKENEKTEDNIACLRTANIQDELEIDDLIYVNKNFMKNNNLKLVKKDDIIMSSANSRELVGKTSYIHDMVYPMTFGGFVLNIRAKRVLSKYLFYMLRLEFLLGRFRGESTQTTNIANINTTTLGKYCFPLPPLSEQQRIVERIESLFAKLDEAKEKVQFVRSCCDDNYAATVHEALTGKLTESWRMRNGISINSWRKDKLGNLGSLERGRSKHRPRNDARLFGGIYPFIQTGDIAEADVYIEKHKQTLSEFGLEQSRMFPKGTLCITIAANIGDVAILSYDCCFPDSVVGFTPCKDVESKYIYYMMSELQKDIEASAPATAQKNINLKILDNIDITIPSIIEQKKIIEILDNLHGKKKQVQEKLEQIVDIIDLMKKSILAKAFRGELGTNNPEEESAIGLLKKILMEA